MNPSHHSQLAGLILLVVGCDSAPPTEAAAPGETHSRGAPAQVVPAPQEPESPSDLARAARELRLTAVRADCTTSQDCAFVNRRLTSKERCCPACARPARADWATEFEALCAEQGEVECPAAAECLGELEPACVDGRCRAVPLVDSRFGALEDACAADTDCVLVPREVRGPQVCCPGCSDQAATRAWGENVEKVCAQKKCRQNVLDECGSPPKSYAARCIDGRCQAIERPAGDVFDGF